MKSLVLLILLFLSGTFAACNKRWLCVGTKCYRKFSKMQTWETARKNCEKHDAVLLKIESEEENDFIMKHYVVKKPTDFFAISWIGLRYVAKTGQFLWTDGSKAKFMKWWADLERTTSFAKKGHPCSLIVNGVPWIGAPTIKGKWIVGECNFEMPYVCEKPQRSYKS